MSYFNYANRALNGLGITTEGDVLSAAAGGFLPVHDVIVTGGLGNDRIEVDWDNPDFVDPASYGPHGRILLDGMIGTDICTLAGANLATRRGCEL